jgi:hypothetical protein
MKFQNRTGANVYIDMGGFVLIRPNEIIELEGHPNCPPLTPIHATLPVKPKKTKKEAKPKNPSASGTI